MERNVHWIHAEWVLHIKIGESQGLSLSTTPWRRSNTEVLVKINY